MRTLALLLLASVASTQGHHRTENRALLGIVAVSAKTGDGAVIRIAHVLERSPAAKAKLKEGDEIVSIAERKIAKPEDVDAALASYEGGEKVAIAYRRDGKAATAEARLIARADYRGDFLKRQRRGATKFEAPEWFVYAWSKAGESPPTRESTAKKVVVIHCFQSW